MIRTEIVVNICNSGIIRLVCYIHTDTLNISLLLLIDIILLSRLPFCREFSIKKDIDQL
jgi:hypothetical protein